MMLGKPPVYILMQPLSSLSSPRTQTPAERPTPGDLTSHWETPFIEFYLHSSFASFFPNKMSYIPCVVVCGLVGCTAPHP